MRISQIKTIQTDSVKIVVVVFSQNGVPVELSSLLPETWGAMSRADKIAWGKQKIAEHLATTTHQPADEIIYPDAAAPETAADAFEQLPGWATWTAAEAKAWITANVTNLATAKTALEAMAQALVYLRDMAIPR